MLKIAVCIKQIPLIEDANFDAETKTIKRDGPAVISAFDLRAIAVAVELKARHGADTTVITMGPAQARAALTDALAMGLDRGVHLEDRAFAGSDTLATARALATWLARESFDLVILGKYSLDAETGQVGPELAELLAAAQITGVRKLEIAGQILRAERESDEGFDEIEARMPAVITCAERVALPVKITPDAQEAAKSKPLITVRAGQLSGDPAAFGFSGSPTWVQEVRVQAPPKTECRMIDASDPERAASAVIDALDAIGALEPRRRVRRPISPQARPSVRGRDLWVACETDLAGHITRASLELLSEADALAPRLGGAVIALGYPAAFASHAAIAASYGADRVVVLDHPGLDAYSPARLAEAVAQLVRARAPWGLLLPASEHGRDWGPRLAARLGLGLTGDAIGIEIDADGRMVALKPAFGGNVVAPILSKTYPQMATVRAGVLELAEPQADKHAPIEIVKPEIAPAFIRLVASHSLLDESLEPLEGAEMVVGVGTGIGGPGGVAQASALARVLHGALCATRRVTDAGWVPRQLQVGLTGKSIDPRLYFAIGVRGAENHTVGIKRAGTVVAINNDPEAPIFERANLGLVADWSAILPAMTEALRNRLR
ncbi:MAG TPA: FAD-binding protein [Candidatus Binataceae bacterium]|nr:FAD-binding protein [Candidatus Binataceae bacterium]